MEPNRWRVRSCFGLCKQRKTLPSFLAAYDQGHCFGMAQPSSHAYQAAVEAHGQIINQTQIGDFLSEAIHAIAITDSLVKVQIRLFTAFVNRQNPAHFEPSQEIVSKFVGR